LDSAATNIFTGTGYEIDYNTQPPTTNLVNLLNYSPLPYTVKKIEYLPLATRYDASWKDPLGTGTLGLGLGFNAWYAAHYTTYNTTNGQPAVAKTGRQALAAITGSSDSSGYWVTLTPSFTHSFMLHTNWPLNLRADGQWASEPLINNEQYGIGGVNSVRGYHEGEAFGDTGWHVSLEQQTPAHLIGMVNGDAPLTISGSAFMDYGQVFLLDPQGRPDNVQLWGTGVGLTSAIGSHWQSRFLVSVPLIGTVSTPRNEPFFNFILTAQF
jgi:hemolysin activation/secretion protein